MEATDFYVHPENLTHLAEAQNGAAGERPPLPDVTKKPNYLSGGGGLTASTADYLKFAEMMITTPSGRRSRRNAVSAVDARRRATGQSGLGYRCDGTAAARSSRGIAATADAGLRGVMG